MSRPVTEFELGGPRLVTTPGERQEETVVRPGHAFIPGTVNGNMRCVIVGGTGQRKSSVLAALLTTGGAWQKQFDRIFVFDQTWDYDEAYRSVDIPRERVFCNAKDRPLPSNESLDGVMKAWLALKDQEGLRTCLFVFDDNTGTDTLTGKAFAWLADNGRKQGMSWVISANEVVRAIPNKARQQVSAVIMFKPTRKVAMDLFDFFCPVDVNQREFFRLLNHATSGPGHFLCYQESLPPRVRWTADFVRPLTL